MHTTQPASRSDATGRVALYEPSGEGGIAHYTFELADALVQAGWSVTLLTAEGYELDALPRRFAVRYVYRASRLKAWWRRVWARRPGANGGAARRQAPTVAVGTDEPRPPWREWLNSVRFAATGVRSVLWLAFSGTRIVHVQWLLDRRADLFFVRLLRLCGFTVILTVHDVLPHDEYTEVNRRYFEKLYRAPHRLIVHSENNRRELLSLFALDPAKVSIIPLGAQTVFTDHFDVTRSAARASLDLPDAARIILFFGLIKRYKGLEYLLEAFETITSRCENVMLLVAGKIYEGDADVHRHYTQLLAGYRDRPDIRLDSRYIPLAQVSRYFSAADLVVLPYVKASQSAVLLSAYAAGRAVVATETGGLGEVVADGVSGMMVPPKDAAAIAEAAIAVLNDPDALRRMGLEAKRLADTTYSWANIAAETGILYRSLR